MPRPCSNDLRERVVSAVKSGESCRAVASRFGVSVSSVVKWHQRYRARGSVAPGQTGGYRRRILEAHRDFIIEQLKRTPHLTLHSLKDILAALRHDGLTAPCVFDGSINGICFLACVEQQLVQTLKPGDIVIMDNLGSHKSKAVRNARLFHV